MKWIITIILKDNKFERIYEEKFNYQIKQKLEKGLMKLVKLYVKCIYI